MSHSGYPCSVHVFHSGLGFITALTALTRKTTYILKFSCSWLSTDREGARLMSQETRKIPACSYGWFATNSTVILLLLTIYLRLSPCLTCFLFPVACFRLLSIWYPGPVCIAPPFPNLLDPSDCILKACLLHDWFLPMLVSGFELSSKDPALFRGKIRQKKYENKVEVSNYLMLLALENIGIINHYQQHSSTTSCLVDLAYRWRGIRRLR